MKHVFRIYLILLLGFPLVSPAQFIGIGGRMDPEVKGIAGRVLGPEGASGVPYAHLLFIHGKDTVKLACDVLGAFQWETPRLPDTLQVRVSALGYKTLDRSYVPRVQGNRVYIRLEQELRALNEVIITAKKVYMVVKGDTLEYKAESFKTLDGDLVGNLLKKLPGVSMDNGTLTVNGEPISRIYVNNEDFGLGAGFVLNNIRADNVKDIQVYDERDKADQARGMKFGERQTVMNVVTKKKVNRSLIRRNTLLLGAGLDASRDQTSHFKEKWHLKLDYHFPLEPLKEKLPGGKEVKFIRTLGFSGEYTNVGPSNDEENSSFQLRYSNMDNMGFHNCQGQRPMYSTDNKFNGKRVHGWTLDERDYFPTADYTSRYYAGSSTTEDRDYSYSTVHRLRWKGFLGKVQYEGKDRRREQTRGERSETDGELVASAFTRDRTTNHSSLGSGNFSFSFPKLIALDASFSLGQTLDESTQVDTLPESSRPVHLERSYDGYNASWGLGIRHNKITSLYKLDLGYRYNSSEKREEGQSENLLTGRLDTNGTRDFTLYEQRHELEFRLSRFTQKTSVTSHLNVSRSSRSLVDRFPSRLQHRDHFLLVRADLKVNRKCSPELNWDVQYSLLPLSPTIPQLRREIRTDNPLFLTAGNPGLKPSKTHQLVARLSRMFVSSSSQLEFSLSARLVQDLITGNQRYFTETTYLPEYDYTVMAGATFTTPVNTRPEQAYSASLDYSNYSGLLESKLNFHFRYDYKKTPSFQQGERNALVTENGMFRFGLTSGFSRKVELVLLNSLTLSRSRSDLDRASNILKGNSSFTLRASVLPKLKVNGTFSYDYTRNGATDREFNQTDLRVDISRTLGKYNTLKLEGINLLDRQGGVSFTKTADYTARREASRVGRYVMLTLTRKIR